MKEIKYGIRSEWILSTIEAGAVKISYYVLHIVIFFCQWTIQTSSLSKTKLKTQHSLQEAIMEEAKDDGSAKYENL